MKTHWSRLWDSLLGRWTPEHPGFTRGGERLSGYKGYWGELGHSLKNVLVEALRHDDIWDRKG
jgi:hypothetical protein